MLRCGCKRILLVAIITVSILSAAITLFFLRAGSKNENTTSYTDKYRNLSSISCVYSDWSEWSKCAPPCTDGRRASRKRSLLAGNPFQCSRLEEQRHCSCIPDLPCVPEPWGTWSSCSTSCGFGTRRRIRPASSNPTCKMTSHGSIQEQSEPCKNPPCDPTRGKPFQVGAVNQSKPLWGSFQRMTLPQISCEDESSLEFIDTGPFARGYTKEVWRALWKNKSVVVKKAISKSHISRFLKGIKWEEKWLTMYGREDFFMNFYGICREGNAFEAVEGNLTKWHFLMHSNATWCFRLNMVVDAVAILEFLDTKGLFHCDWKYDQAAINQDGKVKLVDVKSLRWLNTNRTPYKGGVGCSRDETCNQCEKSFYLPYEHKCINGRCPGYNTATMISVTAQSFVQPLLLNFSVDSPGGNYEKDIQELIANCNKYNPTDRWSLGKIKSWLQDMMARYNAHECLERESDNIKKGIQEGYKEMILTSDSRCGSQRYC